MKIKKILIPSLLLLVTLFVFHVKANTSSKTVNTLSNLSPTLLDSNLFTQPDDLTPYTQENVDMTGFTKTLENEELILYMNDKTLAIRIQNKETGFVFSSDVINLSQYRNVNPNLERRVKSGFSFSFIDKLNRQKSQTFLDVDDVVVKKQTNGNSVTVSVDLEDYEIKLAYTLSLNGKDLQFNLDHESIEEYGTYRLMTITFFEFLGAAYKNQIPGYNFIPSGSGALVRYGDISPISSQYRARFYGQDLYYSSEDNTLALNYPIYGSVHGINQNAFLMNITSGAEYAMYNYAPTGYSTDFHVQFTSFYLRERYIQTIAGSTTSTTIIEKDLKDYDISFNISFLENEDANYVGMAKAYKDYLVAQSILTKETKSNTTSVHLDVLGSDYEEGIFFNKLHKMTSTSQLLEINDELTSNGVNEIFYTLRGFNKGGYTNSSYNNTTFNKALGNVNDLSSLDVTYYYNPTVRFQNELGAPKNTLQTITKAFASRTLLNGEYYQYFTDIDAVINQFSESSEDISAFGGMALDGLSNTFYTNKNYTRTQMYDIYQGLLTEKQAMYNPNFVLLGQASKVLTLPLQHERFRFFTDQVPFMQIVLSGYLPYYSNYLNFSANMNVDVLKVIDFGANPAYLITAEESHLLTNTLSREYYASYYGNLNNYIIDQYEYINEALKHVQGEEITSRNVLQGTDDSGQTIEGLVSVIYSNDVEILINYSNQNYVLNGNQVNSQDYFVRM